MSRRYITTPIYYVNDRPHIGHAYTTIAADVLNRYYRGDGFDTFFLTGTDEHGQKVEKAAAERGITPKAHCDEMAPRFRELWKLLDVLPSAFIRTTDPEHKDYVRSVLTKLHEKGLIVRRDFEGWYCTPDERFWTEKDLGEGTAKLCPECGRELEFIRESNYFFLLSRFTERIRSVIDSGELLILPESRRNEVLGLLNKGLIDLCISRPLKRLTWGIPLPFDPEYVSWVWFDALFNYVSGPRYLAGAETQGTWWPASVHIIGKDILTTHAVYWPAFLMAAELELPRSIIAHGWWNFSGEKMSKSIGNVVDPVALIDEYSVFGKRTAVDAFRYFLLAETAFGSDGTFSFEAFERRWTAELSNDVGNLVSRAVSLVEKLCGGSVDSLPTAELDEAIVSYRESLEQYQFHRTLETAIGIAKSANQYLQEAAPWANKGGAGEVLGRVVASIAVVASMLRPFMPASSDEIARRLGLSAAPPLRNRIESFHSIVKKGDAIFPKPVFEKKESGATGSRARPTETLDSDVACVSIDDVKKLGLRIGTIVSAEKIEGADRLLRLRVDIGTEVRTLVAGIAKSYDSAALPGRNVVVVTNLKPAKIRGVESRGMILAASYDDGVSLVAPDRSLGPGSEVK